MKPIAGQAADSSVPLASERADVIAIMLNEEARRRNAGRGDHSIPMRPDHGALLAGDPVGQSQPGYSWLGRLKGMGELRGMTDAIERLGLADGSGDGVRRATA